MVNPKLFPGSDLPSQIKMDLHQQYHLHSSKLPYSSCWAKGRYKCPSFTQSIHWQSVLAVPVWMDQWSDSVWSNFPKREKNFWKGRFRNLPFQKSQAIKSQSQNYPKVSFQLLIVWYKHTQPSVLHFHRLTELQEEHQTIRDFDCVIYLVEPQRPRLEQQTEIYLYL